MTDRLVAWYRDHDDEAGRLGRPMGRLEHARTMDVLARHLPPPPATVLDVGGGPGAYAVPLAGAGYEVALLDLVPLHVAQARDRAAVTGVTLASAQVGDARSLPYHDDTADAVLLLGPLYHLHEEADRIAVLKEAARVARPGAPVIAAGISRYASALDGLRRELLSDPKFAAIVEADLQTGRHDNPDDDPRYFTTAYFHEPGQLEAEARTAGLEAMATLAIEGPAALLEDVGERLDDPERRMLLLDVLRRLEAIPSLCGVSWHHVVVARAR